MYRLTLMKLTGGGRAILMLAPQPPDNVEGRVQLATLLMKLNTGIDLLSGPYLRIT